jgi:hypothetical protein
MRATRKVGQVSLAAIEDAWQRRATDAAIAAARKIIDSGGSIPPGTPIGRLGDREWGWLVAAILFGWICTRAEQATAEQIDTELAVRMTGLDPDPWDAGAIASILPQIATALDIDWTKPLADWPREMMLDFLTVAFGLIRKAVIARDLSSIGITRKSNPHVIAREENAAAGSPLMTSDELSDSLDNI